MLVVSGYVVVEVLVGLLGGFGMMDCLFFGEYVDLFVVIVCNL